jgi:hypothetical protein
VEQSEASLVNALYAKSVVKKWEIKVRPTERQNPFGSTVEVGATVKKVKTLPSHTDAPLTPLRAHKKRPTNNKCINIL